jgi:hypothetical protein
MGMHTARRRGELLVLSMLSLLVLAVTVLVAVSIVGHRTKEPRLTQFVQISDQGPPPVDPFGGEPTKGATPQTPDH